MGIQLCKFRVELAEDFFWQLSGKVCAGPLPVLRTLEFAFGRQNGSSLLEGWQAASQSDILRSRWPWIEIAYQGS